MPKRDWNNRKNSGDKKNLSLTLFLLVAGLTFFGVLMIYNASVVEADRVFNDQYYYLKNQAVWALVGLAAMIIIANLDYRIFKKLSGLLLLINLIMLAAVLIPGFGTNIKGASRWLRLGPVIFQPSELIKLTLCLYLAGWLEKEPSLWQFLILIGLVSGLIIAEPDLGTLVVIVANSFLVYYLSGAPLLNLGLLSLMAGGAGLLGILSSAYRRERLLTYLDPARDPLGSSYHIRQILIALGAGGFFGLGLGQSRQKYEFLPEATTDSIFAIIAEEGGFLSATVVIIAFVFLLALGFIIARRARDKFGRLLAAGITGWIGLQVLVNLGGMVALLPLTGLPLPFISYGGSSLVAGLMGVGLMLSVWRGSK